jgi:ATP-dependent RNA helicase SUPV3L1/SUV3
VRVDILERLADLIRPLLAWRETSPGEKPAGAFDGRGFVVTQAMTSLTGSAGEDFASILRALGYRMDRRPPLPPKPAVVAPAAPETPALEVTVEASAEIAAEASAEIATEAPATSPEAETALPVSGDPVPSAALLPEASPALAGSEAPPAVIEAQPEPAAVVEAPAAEVSQEHAAADATLAPAGVSETAPSDATVAPAAPSAAAAPELVEVWRPAGRSDERRPRHDRGRHRHPNNAQDAAQPAAGAGEAGQGERQGEKREHHRRGRRHRDFHKPREGATAEVLAPAAPADIAPASPASEVREDKPSRRERFEGKGGERDGERRRDKFQQERRDERRGDRKGDRDKGGRDKGGRDFGRDKAGGRDKRESGPSHRQYATSASPRERERPIDPNSPFAKLAALKEQLTANRKD